eukprot:CAMPEP_0197301442 /NCGR_PEP_ID=MMETSP0890-20130614/50398_1 /TAXON_ID=44058 ORGANISM="Aureoumbra lagunensis, Strain CCMP1510" /NCGR_SAMPLE_ID=MMETSP0890 /ASSEMBLY_ACC=CAM_ASM_000533 /LENGTH=683 /DNA_ID=CAMNT_0042780741 /DNA_START=1545 /DNA_END=3593 /DNA_ORIENTATION=+
MNKRKSNNYRDYRNKLRAWIHQGQDPNRRPFYQCQQNFNSTSSTSKSTIRLATLNATGLFHKEGETSGKISELASLLYEAEQNDKIIHVLAIQETFAPTEAHSVRIEGYTWYGRHRTKRHADSKCSGGIGLLVHNSLLVGTSSSIEQDCILGGCEGYQKLTLKRNRTRITIFNVYHELDRADYKIKHTEFHRQLFNRIKNSVTEDGDDPNKLTCVLGDFNTRLGIIQDRPDLAAMSPRSGESCPKHKWAKSLVDGIQHSELIIIHGRKCDWDWTFFPIRNKASNASSTPRSVIDYCLIPDNKWDQVLDAGISRRDSFDFDSHHHLLWFTITNIFDSSSHATSDSSQSANKEKLMKNSSSETKSTKKPKKSSLPYHRRRIMKNKDDLQKLLTKLVQDKFPDSDYEQFSWDIWKDLMIESATHVAPQNLQNFSKKKGRMWEPFWTVQGSIARKNRQKAAIHLELVRKLGQDTTNAVKAYKEAHNAFRKRVRSDKLKYYRKLNNDLANLANDASMASVFWQKVLGLASKRMQKDAQTIALWLSKEDDNEELITDDPKLVAQKFCKEYAEIGSERPPSNHNFDLYARNRMKQKLDDLLKYEIYDGPASHSITESEIIEVIKKLKPGKATGLDCISTELLKSIAVENHTMITALASIFTNCLLTGNIPKEWQIAIVKPVFKSGDRADW